MDFAKVARSPSGQTETDPADAFRERRPSSVLDWMLQLCEAHKDSAIVQKVHALSRPARAKVGPARVHKCLLHAQHWILFLSPSHIMDGFSFIFSAPTHAANILTCCAGVQASAWLRTHESGSKSKPLAIAFTECHKTLIRSEPWSLFCPILPLAVLLSLSLYPPKSVISPDSFCGGAGVRMAANTRER